MRRRLLLFFSAAVIAIAAAGIPSSAQAESKPQACMKASDCRGPLPRLCKVCGDGISRCAHWTCANSQCAVEICPGEK